MRFILVAFIRLYKLALSPLFPPACRFYPSCSQYTLEAIQKHGSLTGLILGLKRLARCHPYHPGGVDLVPEPRKTLTER